MPFDKINYVQFIDKFSNTIFDDIEKESILNLKRQIKKNNCFCLNLNLDHISNLDLFSKKLVKLYEYSTKKNINTFDKDNLLAKIKISDISKDNLEEILNLLHFFSISDVKKRYEYIYDTTSQKLDELFLQNNYCKFENNACIRQRERKNSLHSIDGCCYRFHCSKFLELPVDEGRCKELKPGGGCDVNSMACKFFTCKFLRKQGIKFDCNTFFLTRVCLNKKQKNYLESCFFIRKEKNIEKLIELENK